MNGQPVMNGHHPYPAGMGNGLVRPPPIPNPGVPPTSFAPMPHPSAFPSHPGMPSSQGAGFIPTRPAMPPNPSMASTNPGIPPGMPSNPLIPPGMPQGQPGIPNLQAGISRPALQSQPGLSPPIPGQPVQNQPVHSQYQPGFPPSQKSSLAPPPTSMAPPTGAPQFGHQPNPTQFQPPSPYTQGVGQLPNQMGNMQLNQSATSDPISLMQSKDGPVGPRRYLPAPIKYQTTAPPGISRIPPNRQNCDRDVMCSTLNAIPSQSSNSVHILYIRVILNN